MLPSPLERVRVRLSAQILPDKRSMKNGSDKIIILLLPL